MTNCTIKAITTMQKNVQADQQINKLTAGQMLMYLSGKGNSAATQATDSHPQLPAKLLRVADVALSVWLLRHRWHRC